ncbi:MAG: LPS-assembly protein LptD, partial [Bacteroidota bacterium]
MYFKLPKKLLLTIPVVVFNISTASAGKFIPDTSGVSSTVVDNSDTIPVNAYSTDTVSLDTGNKGPASLDAPVDYNARDSIVFSLSGKKIYLYGEGKVNYQQIELTADYVEFDMDNQTVYATGLPDSTGEMAGEPLFKEGVEEFKAHTLTYNFSTKKGVIKQVITEQEGGYLHAERTKRQDNGHIHIK